MDTLQAAYRKVVSKDLVLSLEHHADYDNELDDFYGKFSEQSDGLFYVDRKKGFLRGPSKTWTEDFPTEYAKEDRRAELEELGYDVEDVFTAITVTVNEIDGDGLPVSEVEHFTDDDEYKYEDYWRDLRRDFGWNVRGTEERAIWRIEVTGDEILADDLSTRWDDRTFRYQNFVDGYGHFPKKPWETCTDEEKAEHIKYMKEVYQRAHDYFMDRWGFIGVKAQVHWKSEEIGSSSMWGIETDMDDVTMCQYESELIGEALSEAVNHFHSESERYGVKIAVPQELLDLDAKTIDELKVIRDQIKASQGPWHPSGKRRIHYGQRYDDSIGAFLETLEDDEKALYTGIPVESDESE